MTVWIGVGLFLVSVATLVVAACLRAQNLASSVATRFMEDVEQMRAVRPRPRRRATVDPAVPSF